MTSVLFGSISTIADTSEMQRQAFNDAFAEHGLDWTWERAEYRRMLTGNGGRDRIASYAEERGEDVDADAVHATKSRLFQEALASSELEPRPGVAETIRAAADAGHRCALVTTTSPQNVRALLDAVSAHLPDEPFALVLDRDSIGDADGKPSPAAYEKALADLGVDAGDAVAVEDNTGGVQSARAAGIACAAFPNANTSDHDFGEATAEIDRVDLDALLALLSEKESHR